MLVESNTDPQIMSELSQSEMCPIASRQLHGINYYRRPAIIRLVLSDYLEAVLIMGVVHR